MREAKPFRVIVRGPVFWAAILLLLMLPCLFSLLTISRPNPSTVAASDLAEEFQSALDAFQKQYGFPGATAAYLLQDGTASVAATGVADEEAGTPMTVQSRMLSASIGKTFVGATVIALAREGILDLDIPVSRWIGDRQWFTRLPNHNAITVRHLLAHSSGLPDHVHLDSFATAVSRRWREKDNPFPPDALIQFILDLPPLFEVGKGWAYTDTGYILIGLVIEKATGRSYYDEIKERFLTPLGLTLTTPADRRFLPGLAAGYMAADNAFGFPRKTTTADGAMVWHPGLEWTGGGLVSNSRDLALWGTALFGGNAMSGSYLDELLNSVPISPDTPDIQYGAGVGVNRTGPFGVGFLPEGIAFDGANIWVGNGGNSTVTKLRASDGIEAAGSPFAVGNSPKGVAFDGVNIWVVNQNDGTVSKR